MILNRWPQSMHFMLTREPGPECVNGWVCADPQRGHAGRGEGSIRETTGSAVPLVPFWSARVVLLVGGLLPSSQEARLDRSFWRVDAQKSCLQGTATVRLWPAHSEYKARTCSWMGEVNTGSPCQVRPTAHVAHVSRYPRAPIQLPICLTARLSRFGTTSQRVRLTTPGVVLG